MADETAMHSEDAAPVPRYVQITDHIRRNVGARTDAPGDRLPSLISPPYQIGGTAARIALERAPGRVTHDELIALSTRLIIRASCGGTGGQEAACELQASPIGS